MRLIWTEEERFKIGKAVLAARAAGANETDAAAQAAVELVAARGGVLAADVLTSIQRRADAMPEVTPDNVFVFATRDLLAQCAAQGATVATLQAKVEELAPNVDRAIHYEAEAKHLRAEVERLKGWREKCINDNNAWAARLTAAESSLAAIDHERDEAASRFRGIVTRIQSEDVEGAALAAAEHSLLAREPTTNAVRDGIAKFRSLVLEDDAPQEATHEVTEYDLGDGPFTVTRYPCSPTCTHDDAANPGHPERVKERSERLNEALFRADDDNTAAESDAYDKGAEAMRAACWEAVDALFVNQGLLNLRAALKAAIEGAVP